MHHYYVRRKGSKKIILFIKLLKQKKFAHKMNFTLEKFRFEKTTTKDDEYKES